MAFIKVTGNGKQRRYIVNFHNTTTGGGDRVRLRTLDDAMSVLWQKESSSHNHKTREEVINAVRRWPLQKIIWFWLGSQHERLNHGAISVLSYERYSIALLNLPPALLAVPVSKILPVSISQNASITTQRLLRMAFGQLIKANMLAVNPVSAARIQCDKYIEPPAKKTIRAMLEDAACREQIAIWLGAVCGLRIGEVMALTYRDVSREKILIRRHLTPQGMKSGTKRGKGRPVSMPPELYALLDKNLIGTDAPVIAGQNGRHLSLNYGRSGIVKRLLNKQGVSRFHELRHFAVSNLIERGAKLTDVMEFAGHTDAAITMRVYGHLLRHIRPLVGMLDE